MKKSYEIVKIGWCFALLWCTACRLVSPTNTDGKVVILDKKRLSTVSSEWYMDTTITTLSLFGNHLTSISDSIGRLKHLEVLYLGKNDFTSFPKAICSLPRLRILSLAYNSIDSLPDEIGSLKNLEWLILANNHLVYVSDSIRNCIKLSQLNLNRNNLSALPNGIFKLTEMRVLSINFNQLSRVSDSICALKKLKELHVYQAGALTQLPETTCELRFLEVLQVDPSTVLPTCLFTQKTNRLHIQQSDW
jgi:Leucine-rich repeat (LRR) protein